MDYDDPPGGIGENVLTIVLTGVAAAGFLAFLIVISGGYFLFLVAVLAAIALFALLHYLLWGHALSEELANDDDVREAVKRDEAEALKGFVDDPHFPRGY